MFHGYATPIQHPLSTDTICKGAGCYAWRCWGKLWKILGGNLKSVSGRRERDGVPLEMLFVLPDTEETRQIADILAHGWRRLGVAVTMNVLAEEGCFSSNQG